MKQLRFLLLVFLTLMYFPTTAWDVNLYRIVGGALAFGALGITLVRKQLRLPRAYYLVPMLLLGMAGVVGGMAFEEVSPLGVSKMAQNLILLLVVSIVVTQPSDLKLVFGGLALGGGMTVLGGLMEVLQGAEGRIGGILRNANGFGQVSVHAALCLWGLAFCVRRRSLRLLCYYLSVPCLVGMVYSGSRGAVAGLTAAVAVLIFARPTRRVALGFGLLVAVVMVAAMPLGLTDRLTKTFDVSKPGRLSPFETRMDLVGRGMAVYRAYPIFGVGFGSAREGMEEVGVESLQVTHNAVAQLMAETGTVGTVGFLWLLAATAWAFWRAGVRRRQEREGGQAVMVVLALLAAVVVAQLSSGNYIHAIWYALFGVGQSRALAVMAGEPEVKRARQVAPVGLNVARARR